MNIILMHQRKIYKHKHTCVYLCSGPEKILPPALPPGMTYLKKRQH